MTSILSKLHTKIHPLDGAPLPSFVGLLAPSEASHPQRCSNGCWIFMWVD